MSHCYLLCRSRNHHVRYAFIFIHEIWIVCPKKWQTSLISQQHWTNSTNKTKNILQQNESSTLCNSSSSFHSFLAYATNIKTNNEDLESLCLMSAHKQEQLCWNIALLHIMHISFSNAMTTTAIRLQCDYYPTTTQFDDGKNECQFFIVVVSQSNRMHIVISIIFVVVKCITVLSYHSHIVLESQVWYRLYCIDNWFTRASSGISPMFADGNFIKYPWQQNDKHCIHITQICRYKNQSSKNIGILAIWFPNDLLLYNNKHSD